MSSKAEIRRRKAAARRRRRDEWQVRTGRCVCGEEVTLIGSASVCLCGRVHELGRPSMLTPGGGPRR